jgi:stearoyl-CoA desaturase (Delta-9 desaturase)
MGWRAALPALSFNTKIRALQALNHLGAVAALVWLDRRLLLAALAYFVVLQVVAVDAGLHRYFGHKSFETRRWIEVLLALGASLATLGTPIGWAALHRYHHAHADTERDPHSPRHIGGLSAWLGLWRPAAVNARTIADLNADQWLRWLHRNYFLTIGLFCTALALVDLRWVLYFYCLPATLALHGSSSVTVPAHRFGKRRFNTSDASHNNWLTNLMTLGEGWHNNHHHYQRHHRHGAAPGEWDPPAFVIEHLLATRLDSPAWPEIIERARAEGQLEDGSRAPKAGAPA